MRDLAEGLGWAILSLVGSAAFAAAFVAIYVVPVWVAAHFIVKYW